MSAAEFKVVANNFSNTSEIPKDDNLFYRCLDCGDTIPSVPNSNIGCACGNIFIDKDYWRLVVADLSKIEVGKIMGPDARGQLPS